jgi:hypothetical protein
MNNSLLNILLIIISIFYSSQSNAVKSCQTNKTEQGNTLKVPSEYSTIAAAVEKAQKGDVIIIAPGMYNEKEIELTKAITITSEWKLSGDESIIDKTIIDSEKAKLFLVRKDGVEISGLKIINGDHTIEVVAKTTIIHNHFSGNLDAISMEAGAGGYVAHNIIENDKDDGLDIDIGADSDEAIGSDVIVEYNTIINSHDDGIEIRLFSRPNQNIKYTIRKNTIIGSGNAGIQLISYDLPTGKEFYISKNIFISCKTALGCMEGAQTVENLVGASKMDEPVYFFNNTIVNNRMGATGGNTIYAFNNVVMNNKEGGFKRFGKNSIARNNIFYKNGGPYFIEFSEDAIIEDNLLERDPQINLKNFSLFEGSPAINAGVNKLVVKGKTAINIPAKNIAGLRVDLGAIETGWSGETAPIVLPIFASAGNDFVTQNKTNSLKGTLQGNIDNADILWKKKEGPGIVKFSEVKEAETTVQFGQQGIYELTLTAESGILSAEDNITIRYINSGTGKEFFARTNKFFEIEAEDYTYCYGEVKHISNNSLVKMECKNYNTSMLEFSVGMENTDFYTLWIRCKSLGTNNVRIKFNNKEITRLSAPTIENFTWIKVDEKIRASAGQWSMLFELISGAIEIDKIILTPDEKFIAR